MVRVSQIMKAHYHFIGIGGIGMGTLALLLLEDGHTISGSDLKENILTTQLKKKGATIYLGHNREHIQKADYIVYSSAIKEDNPEIEEAKKRNIPILHRAKLLAEVMSSKKAITVAGAHGKTTTSSMVSSLLKAAGFHPTLAVGGIMNNTGASADFGQGEYFVAEVDESDGSFLFFNPFYSIVTNMDFEHMEHYHTWENMLSAYAQLLNQTHPLGMKIICGDDINLKLLALKQGRPILTYGLSDGNDFIASDIRFNGLESCFCCYEKGRALGEIELHIPGQHNVVNALAVVALSRLMGIDFSIAQKSLKDFTGVQRRFTKRGEVNGIMFFDDYAHHPTEIKATLSAARLLNARRVIALFQPHRFSRMKFLQKEFIESIQNCDYLILTDIYAASEEPIEGIDALSILKDLKASSSKPIFYLKPSEIVHHLGAILEPGDLVITLGAGNINQVLGDLIEQSKERFG